MIEFRNVTKHYGQVCAVADVSFRVPKGRVLGLLGRNGAGKTTLMNILTGCIPPSSGTILVGGADVTEAPMRTRGMIGYLPELPPLYTDMTVMEYLRFVAAIKRVAKSDRDMQIARALDAASLVPEANRLIAHLSKGYKQRVGIAQALINDPPIVVLDEPTAGLDPRQIIEIRRLIKRLGETRTVLLSSHILAEISDVCDSVVILHHGRVVAENTLASLTRSANTTLRLKLRVLGSQEQVRAALSGLPIRHIEFLREKEMHAVDLLLDAPRDATDIRVGVFEALAANRLAILSMQTMDIDLEEIFLQLTGDISEV